MTDEEGGDGLGAFAALFELAPPEAPATSDEPGRRGLFRRLKENLTRPR